MDVIKRRIRLSPRLAVAAELLSGCNTVADIGCDHGRLSCYLLQSGNAEQVIAVDISTESLKKCLRLSEHVGAGARLSTRVGDGLSALKPCEADGIAILGMGGQLIMEILMAAPEPLAGAKIAVLSPMRGTSVLRQYLYESGYSVVKDRIVQDAGRLYQVFSVLPPCETDRDCLPEGWPEGCFEVGYCAYAQKEALLPTLIKHRLLEHEKRLRTAGDSCGGKKLYFKAKDLRRILALTEDW